MAKKSKGYLDDTFIIHSSIVSSSKASRFRIPHVDE